MKSAVNRLFSILIILLLAAAQSSAGDTLDKQRTAIHAARNKFNSKVASLEEKIGEDFSKRMMAIAEKALKDGHADSAQAALDVLKELNLDLISVLEMEVKISETEKKNPAALKKTLKEIARNRYRIVEKNIKLADSCFKAGLIGKAYDLAVETFKNLPEEKQLRKLFGYIKTEIGWLRKYEYSKLRKGYIWHEELGWILRSKQDIYDQGKYILDNKVVSLEEANKAHSSWKTPWKIETEHFIIHSNTPIRDVVVLSARIENFNRIFFRRYAGFFKLGKRGAMATLFKMEKVKKLTVYYWKNKEDYKSHLYTLPIPLDHKKNLEDSLGFYSPTTHTSQFRHSRGSEKTLYHEVTHQALEEHVPKYSDAPIWIVEGVATANESAVNKGAFDITFDIDSNAWIHHFKRQPVKWNMFSFMERTYDTFHEEKNETMNYTFACVVATFFMEYENGKYREDFIDYLHDAYFGTIDPMKIKIDRYIQKSQEELQEEFESFAKNL